MEKNVFKKFFEKNFLKNFLKKKFFKKNVKKHRRPSAFFHILHFCIFELIAKKCKKCQKWHFCHFSRFLKTCTAHTPPCFCCKGRQSPWQKPANLYSTKCRIFMRQNPLSRVTVHDSCTTQRRDKFFTEKKIFYSSEILSSKDFKKKNFKIFFFLKYFWKKIFFLKIFEKKIFFYF